MPPVVLPLRVVHNRPFVPLTYRHGSAELRQVWTWLDTGGGAVILGRRLAEQLDLTRSGEPVHDDGDAVHPVASPQIVAGELVLPSGNVQTFVIDRDWIGPAAFRAPAFLPARVLRAFTVCFDYPGQAVGLDPPGVLQASPKTLRGSVHEETGFVRVELDIAGEVFGFLLDTGASYSMISEAVWRRWHDHHPEWPVTNGAHGYAQMVGAPFEAACRMIRVPAAALGPVRLTNVGFVTRPTGTFEEHMSALMDAPIVGALAGNVLRHLRVTIDYQHELVEAQPDQAGCGQDLRVLGLCLRMDGERFLVQSISEDAHPTTRAHIEAGDELLGARGRLLAGADLTDAVDACRGDPGENIELLLARSSVRQVVTVPVVALLE